MNNIFVYCEIDDENNVKEVSLELLTKGRQLADELKIDLDAIVIGTNLKEIDKQIIPYGVDTLFIADDKRLFPYMTLPHTSIIVQLFEKEKPQIALMGATPIGRDLGPRISSSLNSGLTADCTALEIGDYEHRKSGKKYKNLLLQIRPAFGGSIIATIINPDCRPQIATVREGVMKKEFASNEYKRKVVRLNPNDYLSEKDFIIKMIDRKIEKSKINIKTASILVVGGYGVGSKENFKLLYQLADVLGAEVGASRAAVDAGFAEYERQIGQTGITVRPKLYIGCGISGQIQHTSGMSESSIIISINTDKDAPINALANYVIVGSIEEIIPKMIKYYKENSK